MKTLLVFVDSFPFDALPGLEHVAGFYRWQMASGIGFSINIKPHIFGGYTADQVGYFNEWMYTPASRYRRHRLWLYFLRIFSSNYYLDRAVHKVLSRLLFKENLLNIPFQYLSYFDRQGVSPYDDRFHLPTIFSEALGRKWIRYQDFPRGYDRDQLVFGRAAKMIQEEDGDTYFVISADLDSLTHHFGANSKEHQDKLKELDELIGICARTFFKRYPHGCFMFVSDHSMANVNKDVTVYPERALGRAGEDSYLYFVDATMLRFWVFDENLRIKVEEYLEGIDSGRIVTEEERRQYGITDQAFGDFVYLLNEGIVFNPTFWGCGIPKAMHGYHPKTHSQKGFIASNLVLFPDKYVASAGEVHCALSERICK